MDLNPQIGFLVLLAKISPTIPSAAKLERKLLGELKTKKDVAKARRTRTCNIDNFARHY